MRALLYFLPLFTKLTGPLLLSLALSLVTLAAGIGLLGISGWFLTAAALTTAGAAFNLFAPSAGVRGLSFVRILSRYGERLTGHNATLKLLSELRRWLFAKLFGLVPVERRFGRADLVSRLVADIDALDTMFLLALGPITSAAVVGVVMSTLLAVVLPGAAVAYALGFGSAVLLVPAALIALSRAPSAAANAAANELRRAVLDGIDGHQDLVLFGAVAATEASAGAAALRLAGAKRRVALVGSLATAAVQLLAGAILVATLLAGLEALAAGRIEGPVLAGVLLAVVASFEASAVLVRSATRLAGSAAAAERLVAVAETEPAVADPAVPSDLPPGGDVEFAGVTFGYEPGRPVLHELGFTVATGECVAIRGPSGVGKSTIAQLLLRLVDPQAGVVRVNGADLRGVPLSDLRRRVALMTQDAPVFGDSVRANLGIGRPAATDAELWAALEAVRLADAIRQLPRALDAVIGEAGRSLSAGQARRLCLARTLLSEAPIIVLDEPTSGLDAEAEAAFLADLPAIAAGRTMIVITHAEVPATFSRTLSLRAGQVSEQS
ncbi:MAG: thiol reductant ABC exporter subunit CydC [Devosia nanyangense]|uniref:Thiol reductant ABC exporter subunit CydC n=1 Tax=Devosia nanyangense TaxID=1228055 RepID=A0A933L825_9HYPH|nr:thiol reductant ABC exporter subunit CydC [Devosia nanyangense]